MQSRMPEPVAESELSDLELLAHAAQAAEDAQCRGVLGGPGMDEVQLRRAERRARRQDARRVQAVRVSASGVVA
ncbi:hypothetical protein [Saccharopolyspora sp. 6V]|uniref:hypothetical protein n=1 Tax=Saccharopolyspora sp. 6V TaxID=2877239 RepID=UPI001CD624C1|nr:hypothetical protein [Saccharopolyspora sp. 6V]MCA1194179.1 hypothetical protein [Saccharopolyspora sp. 6V]